MRFTHDSSQRVPNQEINLLTEALYRYSTAKVGD
ncbi:hypothetical protein phiYS61_06 [Weissella phage phiYS61]|nr:hypothetical protein phiYS61_06 [Weissella phage phiYS61]AFF27963.1 hypothetical protein phiYS61_06 [Weissella phage phiYS61]